MYEHTPEEILNIFCNLFGGRRSVYTVHGKTLSGKDICRRVCGVINQRCCGNGFADCSQCRSRNFLPISPEAIENHIHGRAAAGIYPANESGLCRFSVIELMGENSEMHLRMLAAVCENFKISHLCEVTESGSCGRLWIFFENETTAQKAAEAAGNIIAAAMAVTDVLPFSLFSHILPSVTEHGDMGKPVILPLFDIKNGYSVFTDDELTPIENIFDFLENFNPQSGFPIHIDATAEDFPKRIDIELCNNLYISTDGMTRRGIAAICRLACFPNPEKSGEFLPDVPVFAKCFSFSRGRIHLPRGVTKDLFCLVRPDSDINIHDGRSRGTFVRLNLTESLSAWQSNGVEAALRRSWGIITAPVGSGKTKIVCGIMERLKRSTLILVTEKSAAVRWRERLIKYFGLDEAEISCVITDRNYPNGRIDIAVLDSRAELRLSEYLPFYGLVIAADVDRLHCAPDVFQSVMECVCAEKVYGVSTKPVECTKYGDYIRMYCGERIY